MTAIRRISKELKDLKDKPLKGIMTQPKEDDSLMQWEGVIDGAANTPYKHGKFKFEVVFPDNFPFKAPNIKFTTKIYHPGINDKGEICIPLLRDDWKPATSLSTVLLAIQEKLNNPSPDDPFEPEIAQQFRGDPKAFNKTAEEWTKKYVQVQFMMRADF